MRAILFGVTIMLLVPTLSFATRIEVSAAASTERSHASLTAAVHAQLQAEQQVRLNEVNAFRLSFYFAPGYCAAGNCHPNVLQALPPVKPGGKPVMAPRREFFMHGLWESPSQNNGFADAVNAADAGGGNRPSWAYLDGKAGLRLKDWYTITNSGIESSQASNAVPGVNAVTMALMQERQDAKFIAIPRGAAGLDANIMGARGGFIQTNLGTCDVRCRLFRHRCASLYSFRSTLL